ncbi:MAG TPA: nicotinate-nucleotide--dimethylbenzimidazole phosphoribosyltransferase, partial [Polyangiales bacterium]
DRLPLAELLFEERWGHRAVLAPPVQRSSAVETPAYVLEPLGEPPPEAQRRNAELTKPYGSLGQLELLALRMCALQRTAHPSADAAHLALFASDHGVTAEGVSAFKADTTLKLVYGYLAGAGVVNAFARQNGVQVHVVDVGVDHDFAAARGLLAHKVRRGTRNLVREPAMTSAECTRAEEVGRDVVRALPQLRVLALGEVGIGNSTSASALAAALLSLSADEVTGRGTGVDDEGLAHKREVVARALTLHATTTDPSALLQRLGGYEIAALVGAIEAAAERRALILLDGLITAVAALIAVRRKPVLGTYLVAAHRGVEPAHGAVLEALALRPLLQLDMRLGEGSGATLAVGLVRASCALLSEVRTYQEANIDRPER